jgi:CheY-like chemotaxis protein
MVAPEVRRRGAERSTGALVRGLERRREEVWLEGMASPYAVGSARLAHDVSEVCSARGRILICDDESGIREILARLLRQEGYEAIETADGAEALTAIQTESVDLVLLDVRLPGADGLEVLQAAMQLRPGLPVVLITSHVNARDLATALRLGARDYVSKPFSHADVLRAVRQVIGARHATHPDGAT